MYELPPAAQHVSREQTIILNTLTEHKNLLPKGYKIAFIVLH